MHIQLLTQTETNPNHLWAGQGLSLAGTGNSFPCTKVFYMSVGRRDAHLNWGNAGTIFDSIFRSCSYAILHQT